MFKILKEVEKVLPALLKLNDWESIDVDYHPPRVERVWRRYGDYRINLHRIHPCRKDEALFHPHPWPSIVKIIEGGYWSKLGQTAHRRPSIVQRTIREGTRIVLIQPGRSILPSKSL